MLASDTKIKVMAHKVQFLLKEKKGRGRKQRGKERREGWIDWDGREIEDIFLTKIATFLSHD
jgi:hypothetical protein